MQINTFDPRNLSMMDEDAGVSRHCLVPVFHLGKLLTPVAELVLDLLKAASPRMAKGRNYEKPIPGMNESHLGSIIVATWLT